jgi:putative transposase
MTITVVHEADGWYVAISCAEVPVHPLPLTGQETGIDVGLKVFLVTAQGKWLRTPVSIGEGEQRLAKAQRRVSRRQ